MTDEMIVEPDPETMGDESTCAAVDPVEADMPPGTAIDDDD